jgi:predicted amidophosphoribosyltransferase
MKNTICHNCRRWEVLAGDHYCSWCGAQIEVEALASPDAVPTEAQQVAQASLVLAGTTES